jgi:hypothetical protein
LLRSTPMMRTNSDVPSTVISESASWILICNSLLDEAIDSKEGKEHPAAVTTIGYVRRF